MISRHVLGGRHSTEESFALLTQLSQVRLPHLTDGKIEIELKNLALRTCCSNCPVSAHSVKEQNKVGTSFPNHQTLP